jgi:hypothetical protein
MNRVVLVAALALLSACSSSPVDEGPSRDPSLYVHPKDDSLRINHLQVKATHNSYHVKPTETTIPDWNYTHAPLDVQLGEQGVRGVELDLYWDANRESILVMHAPLVDPKSTCATLRECLETLRAWSDANPGHHVVFVQLEPKSAVEAAAQGEWLDAIDAEIRAVLPPELLVTPDDVRGELDALADALAAQGWPTLGESRGRFLFSFDCSRELALAYAGQDGRLEGRVMFPDSEEGDPFAGFMIINSPGDAALAAVEAGYLVRVFAESLSALLTDGEEPEEGELRLEAALECGAQVISTDVPVPRDDLEYYTSIPGGTPSRCNPITAPEGCTSLDLEDPSRIAAR